MELRTATRSMAATYMAAGIDPEKVGWWVGVVVVTSQNPFLGVAVRLEVLQL